MITSFSTAAVCHKTGLTDTLQSILNCARAYEEKYVVSFVYERILVIFNDMMWLNLLAANAKVISAR